jgi:DnaK suppressor protein
MGDRVTSEVDRSVGIRARANGQRSLFRKSTRLCDALTNIHIGIAKKTGEPIELKRLEARPIATPSVDAQEHHERAESEHGDYSQP